MEENDNSLPSKQVSSEASSDLLSKRFSKLKHKAMYINMEHEEVLANFKTAQSSFISNMFKYCHDNSLTPPFEQNPQSSSSKKGGSECLAIKELYREIVQKTHPDKNLSCSKEELDELTEFYHEASEGKKDNDLYKILSVALKLDITINNLSSEYLDEIEASISNLEKKISRIQSDVMWTWYYSSPEEQDAIFQKLTKPKQS